MGERGAVKIQMRMMPEYGIWMDEVWVTYAFLEELREQSPLQSDFGFVLLAPNLHVERVLAVRNLLVRETRGGVHRGPALEAFMEALEFPQALTRAEELEAAQRVIAEELAGLGELPVDIKVAFEEDL
jgi:hypothetical protein